MLSKTNRFHGYNSLNWAYRSGAMVRDSRISLKFAPNSRRKSFRAAVVISRKVSKKAVIRNRARRKLYEALSSYKSQLTKPYDLIFTVYSSQLADTPQTELEELVGNLLLKAEVISKK